MIALGGCSIKSILSCIERTISDRRVFNIGCHGGMIWSCKILVDKLDFDISKFSICFNRRLDISKVYLLNSQYLHCTMPTKGKIPAHNVPSGRNSLEERFLNPASPLYFIESIFMALIHPWSCRHVPTEKKRWKHCGQDVLFQTSCIPICNPMRKGRQCIYKEAIIMFYHESHDHRSHTLK